MANYLGRNPAIGTQKLLDSIASQFDGILTTFDLRYSGTPTYPTLSAGLLVSLDGVLQEPSEAYYVSSDKIVFSAAPGAGTECWILLYSEFGVVFDHGLLSGLADDDHAQYLHTTLDRAGIAANISTTGNLGGANLTLTGELRGPSTLVIDPAAVGDDTGLVRIKGGLEVLGTTTTIASTTLTVADKNIVIAQGGSTLSSIDEAGIDFGSTAVRVRYNYNAGVASGLSIEGGNVGIGTTSPVSLLEVAGNLTVSGTGFLSIPAGTGAQRPSTSLVNGMMRYNTSIGAIEAYVQNQWVVGLAPSLDYGSITAAATNSLDYGALV
jgi:hypothetical protein